MPVKLSELAVDALTTLLQANLGTELDAIEADRGDGIALAEPPSTAYYNRSMDVIAGPDASIEVFDGPMDFAQPYTVDTQRAVYTLPMTVRATVFNRDGATAAVMETRRRRYQVAILNVILKNAADLGDAALHLGEPLSLPDPLSERGLDGNTIKFQCSVTFVLKCEELQS